MFKYLMLVRSRNSDFLWCYLSSIYRSVFSFLQAKLFQFWTFIIVSLTYINCDWGDIFNFALSILEKMKNAMLYIVNVNTSFFHFCRYCEKKKTRNITTPKRKYLKIIERQLGRIFSIIFLKNISSSFFIIGI